MEDERWSVYDTFERMDRLTFMLARRRILQIVSYLAAHYPVVLPVRVRIDYIGKRWDATALSDVRGSGSNRHFLLRLDSRLQWTSAVDAILHEWAHFRCWDVLDTGHPLDEGHGPAWQGEYGRLSGESFDSDMLEDSKAW